MSKAVKSVAKAVGSVFGAISKPFSGLLGGLFAVDQKKIGTVDSEPSSQTLRSSKAAARYILGRVSTGGVLAWAQEQAGDQSSNEWLHLVYVLSEGAIDAVEEIRLGEELISTYGSNAAYEVIVNPSQANSFLLENSPDWRETQIGEGLSFVRVSLKYSAEKFPSGIPDARFVVRGRNDIYDPRTGANSYSDNAALLVLWYLRNRCGVPDSEIIMESFASSANTCAEVVANPDDATSGPRYRLGAVIGADERKTDVMQKLLDACAGRLIRVGGKWMLQVGAYYGPYDFTITEDMVIGAVTGTVEVDNDGAINTITGTCTDPEQAWSETDYPAVQVAEWVTEDGSELSESLELGYVNDPYQAQRLANIKLRQRRSGGAVTLPLNFFGYNCRPGRVVRVYLPTLNIDGEFVVTEWSMSATDACNVTLEAYDAEQFDDAVGQPYNPIGFISMPVGGLAPPTGLAWAPDLNPEVRQGVLSWVPPYGEISYFGIVIRNADGEPAQTYQVPGATSNCQVQGLPAGAYTMSVFARAEKGKSAESTINVSILGPPQPQAVSVQAGFDSITLIPFNTNSLNGGTYEYWYALAPVTGDIEAGAIRLGRGGTFTHNGLAFNTTYHYYIRSVNAYGQSGFYYVSATTDSSAENILGLLTGQILETQLGQSLTEKIELISGPATLEGSVAQRIADEAAARALAISDEAAKAAADATAKANAARDAAIAHADVIGAQVADITGADTWSSSKSYPVGDLVKFDGKLYRALKATTAGTAVTNTAYWQLIGSYASLGEAVASSVSMGTQNASAIAAEATQLDAVQARLPSGTGVLATAASVSDEVSARTSADNALGSRTGVIEARLPTGTDKLANESRVVTAENASVSRDNALGSRVTTVEARMPTGTGGLATAASVDSIESRVTTAEGTISSQGASITSLNNSLSTTNSNVTAAQNAANAANTLAGGKGKVIVQSATPGAADQLAQNLWIDTTGGSNTPKRWNGSAWVAVTDKVATDAAAAAASALSQVALKADASAVTALTTRVTNAENTNTSQSTNITSLTNSINAARTQGDNLISNGGFEFDATDWTLPSGIVVVAEGRNGGKCLKYNFAGEAVANKGRAVPVQAGRTYRFSAYYRNTPDFNGTSNNTKLRVGDNAGYPAFTIPLITKSESWIQASGDYVCAVDNSIATLTVSSNHTVGTMWLDDVSFVDVTDQVATANAVQALDTKVIQQGETITSQGTSITSLQNGLTTVTNDVNGLKTSKADASALNSLTTRVTTAEGSLTSQGNSITSLNNSLTTTNSNVTAAQNAANAANTLAGGKGKVLVQSATPGAADQLAQNLWIDTTGGANTPKRWTGSAWAAVTDKVATDAAAAAAQALAGLGGKADAGAVTQLTSRVQQTETGLSATVERVDSMTAQIDPQGAGDADWCAGDATVYAGTITVQSIAATDNLSTNLRIDQSLVRVGQTEASLTRETELRATVDAALASDITQLRATTAGNTAAIQSESSARSTADGALSARIDTAQATANNATASVQQTSQALANLDGELSTMWNVKLQVNANGQYVFAGFGAGIENVGGVFQSQFLVMADRFAILNSISGTVTSPFIVQGGQTIINSAVISQADILNLIVTGELRSGNYIAQQQGIRINFVTGEFELNGAFPGGGRKLDTNRGSKIFDNNNVLRTQLGDLNW
jgi:hypothetical protein